MNKSSIDRGLFVSTSYRTMPCEEKKRSSSLITESICLPALNVRKKGSNYGLLDNQGIVKKGVPLKKGDVIVGKVITTVSKTGEEETVDCSLTIKSGEEGIVDRILVTKSSGGYKLIKVVVRKQRIPELGDKFASRSAQKGIVGMIYNQEDMPFTQDGISPDLLINAHCLPSRMTINTLLETVLGKSCAIEGTFGDGTAFTEKTSDISEEICERLSKLGFERHGNEEMYNGFTGELLKAKIFIGPTFYQKLKHMVIDKVHCLDIKHTEVLTKEGWKYANELLFTDYIASLTIDGELIYETPLNIMLYTDYVGDMYMIETEEINLYVTANHRMLVKENMNENYKFIQAKEVFGKWVTYKSNAIYNVEEYQVQDDFLRKYGGWYLNRITQSCDKLSNWVFKLSKRQALILVNSMLGKIFRGGKNYYTKSKKLADQYQQLLLHCGSSGIISNTKNCYCVRIVKGICSVNKNNINNKIEYNNDNIRCPVFCLEMSSQIFYVRRNGKCAWTGNSRSQGNVTTLTRQPLEGRARDGGLRFGEKPVLPQCYVKVVLVYM